MTPLALVASLIIASRRHQWLHTYAQSEAHRARVQADAAAVEPTRSPGKPTIPPVWSAKVNQTSIMNGVVQTSIVPIGELYMVEDSTKKLKASSSNSKFAYAPAAFVGGPLEFLNFSTFFTEDYMGFEINGQPLDASIYGGRYSSSFAWLPAARDGGMRAHNGTAYQSWTFSLGAAYFELLVDAKGIPVYSEQRYTNAPTVGNYSTLTEYSEWRADASHLPHIWDGFNEDDFKHPKACEPPADPKPIDTGIYVFHPKHQFDLAGQDVGDGQGDVFFVCVDVLTNQATSVDHHYEWISKWTLHHNPHLGQYQNCNGYPPKCLGAEDFLVGHEAAQGLGLPRGGECTANPQVGEWWSLPAGGACKGGETPEGGKCTWTATRTKTIDAKCLLDLHGFKEACAHDARAPFATATKIFLTALAEDDVAKGGCPPLNVTASSSEVDLVI